MQFEALFYATVASVSSNPVALAPLLSANFSSSFQASTPIPFVDILGAQLGHSYEPDAEPRLH